MTFSIACNDLGVVFGLRFIMMSKIKKMKPVNDYQACEIMMTIQFSRWIAKRIKHPGILDGNSLKPELRNYSRCLLSDSSPEFKGYGPVIKIVLKYIKIFIPWDYNPKAHKQNLTNIQFAMNAVTPDQLDALAEYICDIVDGGAV